MKSFGFSIYPGLDESWREKEHWMKAAVQKGARRVFTSLHIPESDFALVREEFKALCSRADAYSLELVADIGPVTLRALGLDVHSVGRLKDWGCSGVRVDYGYSEEEICQISRNGKLKLVLNASTISREECKALREKGLVIENTEAWHNFYPRPETGLSAEFVRRQNRDLKEMGISRIGAFIPGAKGRRAPLYEGLPTLEEHRGCEGRQAAAELFYRDEVDEVLIGDPDDDMALIDTLSVLVRDVIPLRVKELERSYDWSDWWGLEHKNRPDPSPCVIRSGLMRGKRVPAGVALPRRKGAVTVDNEKYGRYMGELHICKTDLPADEKTQVIGQVIPEDLPLLSLLGPGQRFCFEVVRDK
ncbi:MupG family TIM beta-alpha barrel fold protein [Paenactinomyces guangxiensis]|uniref:DUF871 domain-containing protein n=1 Tax=Paenactinomyces guangxiensis TaxID=1490290 RepID=A0A7W1WPG3_9BACL|nr:MupG family TIM beta-alpha barrel fold protein [Paenactinomyces guangxiensis]MBA4493647.1 DUF871 domain-containing protein [Paenactinomyces guangxiensis]MBH8590934.1 DUF871 domain-containing protein [Paenactinomyces guangxiensis]